MKDEGKMIWYSTIDDFAKQIYNRGRKDAIDEVLGLLKSDEAFNLMLNVLSKGEVKLTSGLSDWLEGKLQENKT